MNNKTTALSSRLLLASALLLPLFLGLSAYLLDVAFQRSLLAAEKERLNTHIYLLLAAAELQETHIQMPDTLIEPRFDQLESGLYGFIFDASGAEVWRSTSAELLPATPADANRIIPGQASFNEWRLDKQDFFQFNYDVSWESDDATEQLFRFVVVYSQNSYQGQLLSYRKRLWWLSFFMALMLLLTQVIIMRWGLRPLSKLAGDLQSVERGQTSQLEGNYPKELEPLTNNLNRVLESERKQRKRYRNTMSDLAHSLKTPLAVLRSSVDKLDEQAAETVNDQVSRMDQIVSHQLQRAVFHSHQPAAQKVAVATVVERLADALKKVYVEKSIHFSMHSDDDYYFNGAEADLMEILGNVIENAFKYGEKKVQVTANNNSKELQICVADDGPGISESLHKQLLRRGARADTAIPGHGIGLAIVVDILSSYRGSLNATPSKWGGTEFRITIPN